MYDDVLGSAQPMLNMICEGVGLGVLDKSLRSNVLLVDLGSCSEVTFINDSDPKLGGVISRDIQVANRIRSRYAKISMTDRSGIRINRGGTNLEWTGITCSVCVIIMEHVELVGASNVGTCVNLCTGCHGWDHHPQEVHLTQVNKRVVPDRCQQKE